MLLYSHEWEQPSDISRWCQDREDLVLGPSFAPVHEYQARSQLGITASHANLPQVQYLLESGVFSVMWKIQVRDARIEIQPLYGFMSAYVSDRMPDQI